MSGLFTTLEAFLTAKLNTLLTTYTTVFADKMVILLQAGSVVLVLYYGYAIMTGRGSNATMNEMLWNMTRIAIILGFMKNTDGLLDLSIAFIHELKTGFVGEESVFSLLDQQFVSTQKLTQGLFAIDADFIKLRAAIAIVMIWIGSGIILASSAIVFISAEVGLALLTTTAPIFIGCLTYGFTKELFNGWLRSIFSCIITLIFATLVVRIGIDFTNNIITQLVSAPTQNGLVATGTGVLLTGVIVSFLTLKSTSLAGSIAGVAATSTIQGGVMAMSSAAAGLGQRAGAYSGGKAAAGVGAISSKVRATSSNYLSLASQKAAFRSGQQKNLE